MYDLEGSRNIAVVLFLLTLLFGYLAYFSLLQESINSELGITFYSIGYLYPTHHFYPRSTLRFLLGIMLATVTFSCGFGSLFFINTYLNLKEKINRNHDL